MIPRIPLATYRIQLRGGVDFQTVEDQLDYLKDLGISHLYLSPIFTAAGGSTHGYDVTDPSAIDPEIGGREGFTRMARAAVARDMGVILDIVPNHTAFTLDNPWLADVLRHGRDSRYAPHFDIDWSVGPLVLPFLPEPFEKMLEEGQFSVVDGFWQFEGVRVPLAEGSPQTDDLRALHDAQYWRLRHWEIERDGITHRRFFNVTSLVGMRVEDDAVFADTHRLIFELIAEGLVHGLRVDHIDGLADPASYVEKLAGAVPDTPIWVEKILVGEEQLPRQWAVAGTTGYEAARFIARALTDANGLERLDTLWRSHTGVKEDFPAALATAKRDILENELAAELQHLIGLAHAAAQNSPEAEPGPQSLREAIIILLDAMPRYRTYFSRTDSPKDDKALIGSIVENAPARLRSRRVLDLLARMLTDPRSDADRAFATRLQQVSGALLAKAQEDTAGFRWTRFIAANEVGAEPEETTISEEEANQFLGLRARSEMTLTSTHDTKRSEDSRMRLVAISHFPLTFGDLVTDAETLPEAERVSPRWRWYIVQSALAIWGDEADIATRLAEHIQKAMREAKEESFWTRPDEAGETAACDFGHALIRHWRQTHPESLRPLIARAQALSLAQLAFKCLMPGFPDFYRGSEGPFFALTDPDNRLPVDWHALARLDEADGFAGEKAVLTRRLLALRHAETAFFKDADFRLETGEEFVRLVGTQGGRQLVADLSYTPRPARSDAVWSQPLSPGGSLSVFWEPEALTLS